jgi:cell division protein FtsB
MTDQEDHGPELPLDDAQEADAGNAPQEGEELDSLMMAIDKRPAHATEALDAPPKSLPVLAAFQEFIEDERKRSQNRMLILSGFFLVVLISVIGVVLTIGTFVFRHMREEVTDVRRNFGELQKDSMASKASVDSSLARFQGQADGLRYHMEKQDRQLDEAKKSLAQSEETHDKKLAELRRVIESLETENSVLKTGLTELKTDLPSITQQVDTALAELESELAAIRRLPKATTTTQVVVQVASASAAGAPRVAAHGRGESVVLPITPRGKNRIVDWRLPIPE